MRTFVKCFIEKDGSDELISIALMVIVIVFSTTNLAVISFVTEYFTINTKKRSKIVT